MSSWLSFEVPTFMKTTRPVMLTSSINSRQRRERYRALTLAAERYESWPPAKPNGDDTSDTEFLTSFVQKIQEAEKENTSETNNRLRLLTSSAAMQEVRKVTTARCTVTCSSTSSSSSSFNTSSSSTFGYTTDNTNNTSNANSNKDIDSNIDMNYDRHGDEYNDILSATTTHIIITPPSRPESTAASSPSANGDARSKSTLIRKELSAMSTTASNLLDATSFSSSSSSSSQSFEYGRSLTSMYSRTTLDGAVITCGHDGADDAREIEVDDVLECYL